MKKIIALIACVVGLNAQAFKTCPDDWKFRQDKKEHFGGSIVMAGTFNAFTDDPWKAFGASVAVGGTYELVTGCASIQDFGYDVLGSAIGEYLGYEIKGFILTPNRIAYKMQF